MTIFRALLVVLANGQPHYPSSGREVGDILAIVFNMRSTNKRGP